MPDQPLPQAAVDAALAALPCRQRTFPCMSPEAPYHDYDCHSALDRDDMRAVLAAAAPHLAATEREHIAQAAEIQALAHLAEGSRIAADALKRFAEVIRNPEGT